MTRTILGGVVAGLLSLAPLEAHAQKPADDAATVEAKARFNEGIKLADQGEHEAAHLKFGQAWALLKSPAVLFNLARSEQLSNHLVEALEHFRLYRKMNDPKITEDQRKRAADNIAQLVTQVCHIDVEAPPGARVTIDGHASDWTTGADPIAVLPGAHTVEATVDGKPRTEKVQCAAGTSAKAKLTAPPPPPEPVKPPPPPPAAPPPAPEPPGFWTTGRAVGAGLVGGGLLAVGAGVLFQLQAGSAGDDADALRTKLGKSGCTATPEPPDCATLRGKNDDQSSAETLRTVFFISGGALIIGGAALFVLSPPKPTGTALRVVPILTGRDAGLQVLGRF